MPPRKQQPEPEVVIDETVGPTPRRPSVAQRSEEIDLLRRADDVKRKRQQAKRIDEANKITSHPECVPKAKDKKEGMF